MANHHGAQSGFHRPPLRRQPLLRRLPRTALGTGAARAASARHTVPRCPRLTRPPGTSSRATPPSCACPDQRAERNATSPTASALHRHTQTNSEVPWPSPEGTTAVPRTDMPPTSPPLCPRGKGKADPVLPAAPRSPPSHSPGSRCPHAFKAPDLPRCSATSTGTSHCLSPRGPLGCPTAPSWETWLRPAFEGWWLWIKES